MPESKTEPRQQTVTQSNDAFALLVPASSEDEADGEAIFQPEIGVQWVRRFTPDDGKKVLKGLRGVAQRRFTALNAMKDAMDLKYAPMLQDARKRLEDIYRDEGRELAGGPFDITASPEAPSMGEYFAARTGLSPKESLKHLMGPRIGPKAYADPFRLFSYEVTQRIGLLAQLALWREKGRCRPAIYCMYPVTALYVHTFLLTSDAGLGWRVCPIKSCRKDFLQKRANQICCNREHENNWRQVKHRYKKKTN
jgi:hypothetical protein